MASTNEQSRAMTLGRFKILQIATSKLSSRYNPQQVTLRAGALLEQYDVVKFALSVYNKAQGPYKKASGKRKAAFVPVSNILTRVRGEVKTLDLSKADKAQVVKNVETINRGYRGAASPATIAKAKEKAAANEAEIKDEELDSISVAQTSFMERANHVAVLIAYLSVIPEYNTKDEELSIKGLNALLQILEAHNDETNETVIDLQNARTNLIKAFDAPDTGMIDVALAVKEKIKSTYGAESAEYRQVSGLEFRREKK
jgi:uncharacterized protein YejL (UPF0352 family)